MKNLNRFLQKTFAVWVILFAGIAMLMPDAFVWLKSYITWMLGIIMFGMGMTMSVDDFKSVLSHPKAVAVGVGAQFIVMPALAWILCILFRLPSEIAVGVLLVGCCPGGTASNVIAYMAKANVALSVACTSVSTILAPILTPAIFYLLASQWIEIDALAMFISVIQVILIPIILGLIIRTILKQKTEQYVEMMPLISVVAIVLIVAAIIAGSKMQILESGFLILAVVMLHNGLGYFIGYWAAKWMRLKHTDAKAISIEVGMQNSGLGVALAAVHFAATPISAVPSAIFSLWHNISGPALATYWASKVERREKELGERDQEES